MQDHINPGLKKRLMFVLSNLLHTPSTTILPIYTGRRPTTFGAHTRLHINGSYYYFFHPSFIWGRTTPSLFLCRTRIMRACVSSLSPNCMANFWWDDLGVQGDQLWNVECEHNIVTLPKAYVDVLGTFIVPMLLSLGHPPRPIMVARRTEWMGTQLRPTLVVGTDEF